MSYSKLKAYKAGVERYLLTTARFTWLSKRWWKMKVRPYLEKLHTRFNFSYDFWRLSILGMFVLFAIIDLITSIVEIETHKIQFEIMLNKPDVVINRYYNIPR